MCQRAVDESGIPMLLPMASDEVAVTDIIFLLGPPTPGDISNSSPLKTY